ncbi:MAG: amidohydrolase family protein [Candidatus Cloacimonetes bacterium]|nr:amidohydrolase family protein [Candidatus Cloacimonadota bacterium]
MKIIDSHLHFSRILAFEKAAAHNGVNYSQEGLISELSEHQVVAGVCMGLTESEEGKFPDEHTHGVMNCDLEKLPDNIYFCAGINPHKLDSDSLSRLGAILQQDKCAGIKIYAGYYQFYVADDIYEPVYELALKYQLPVVIHSGSTYSPKGLLKYSHPLTIDDLATKHPHLKIVVAHFGNPWIQDVAELIYKHENIYVDLSGILEGDAELFHRISSEELYMNRFRTALIQADNYRRFMYGSDWPLSSMKIYIDFIKRMIPQKHWQAVFYDNALEVFERIKFT